VREAVNGPGSPEAELDARLAAAAERLGHATRLLLRAAAARNALSIIQAQLLMRLASDVSGVDSSVTRLAQWFDVRQPTISDAIAALERKSLVTRRRRGRRRLELTSTGQTVARDLAVWDAPLRPVLASQPAVEKGVALEVMLQAIAGLHAAGVVTVAHSCTTCRFFRPRSGAEPDAAHHCALLDVPLRPTDLRLDCPEHQPVPA
jgi:DNA-binding MarR family transcriptional regulator